MQEDQKTLGSPPPADTGQRGPAEHERREQIISAAGEHFRHYGYEKTTVADLAKAIGLSKAYIYKFFDSKQAIGQAVCTMCLAEISDAAMAVVKEHRPASERLRRVFKVVAQHSGDMFFHDRKIHDLATTSINEKWSSTYKYKENLLAIVRAVLRDGREAGEFERKTPLDETARAIMLALDCVTHPAVLVVRLDTLDEDAMLMANLVLRSLAP
jgi:AcrR family transcriptional regulator